MGKQHKKKWTDEAIAKAIVSVANQFCPVRMPTKSETSDITGSEALANAICKNGGFNYWAERLGLEQKYSETKLGMEGERYVADYLKTMGFSVELTSAKYPYDLLVERCVKVDVKTANISYSGEFPLHSYRLAKGQQTCDFYIFLEIDTKKMYVVPAHKLYGQVQVGMGLNGESYANYLGAFALIRETSELYQRM